MGHTPGPWAVNPFCAQVDCQKFCDDGTLVPVCRLLWPTKYCSEDETEANARLIAAAPELLEALERIAQHTDPDDPESYRADDREGCLDTVQAIAAAAIAKAKGEDGEASNG